MNKDSISYNEDIYIGIKQLSEYLIGSTFISLDDDYTYLSRDNKETTLYYSNNKLIKSPGYEVLIFNIDSVNFERCDDLLYINIKRNEDNYRFMISYIQEKVTNDEE